MRRHIHLEPTQGNVRRVLFPFILIISLMALVFVTLFATTLHDALTRPDLREDKLLFLIPAGLGIVFVCGVLAMVVRWYRAVTRQLEDIQLGVMDVTPVEGGYLCGELLFGKGTVVPRLLTPGSVMVVPRDALATLKADAAAWGLVGNPDEVPDLRASRGPRHVLDAIVPLRDKVKESHGDWFAVVTCDDPKYVIDVVRTDYRARATA